MPHVLVRLTQRMFRVAMVFACLGLASTAAALALPGTALASAPTVGVYNPNPATSTGATVNALVNPEGETASYHFDYDQDSSSWCQSGGTSGSPTFSTPMTQLGFTDSTDHQVSAMITGLTPNTGYCFEAVASNTDGTTDGGMDGFTTLAAAPLVSTGSASSITGTGATFNGTVNPEGQSTQYQFEYDYTRDAWCQSGGASGSPAGSTPATTLGFTDSTVHAVSATITGFTPSDSICFALEASNAAASAVGATATITTTALVVTTGSASSVINGGATLSGSINPEGQPTTTYYFQAIAASAGSCTSAGVGQATASTSLGYADSVGHAVSATLSGLTPSTTYCFRLAEYDSSFSFTYGAFATFTTPPPVTLTVHVTADGESSGYVTGPNGSNPIECTNPQPGVNSTCAQSFVQGTVVTLTEFPDTLPPGVGFGGWSGACSGTGPTCTVTLSGDESVGASFTAASSSPPPSPSSTAIGKTVSSSLQVTASVAAILRAGGYQPKVSALAAGTLSITWSTGSGTHGTRSVVVASGSKTFSKAGAAKLKIKLTKAGRALLKRSRHLKLTAAGSFKPKHGKMVTKVRTITLTG
jgi:hypothetical protein